jgi:hypothetical protein
MIETPYQNQYLFHAAGAFGWIAVVLFIGGMIAIFLFAEPLLS